MVSERERLKKIMQDMARGQDIGHKLKFDPRDKKVKPTYDSPSFPFGYRDPDGDLDISRSDADLFSGDHEPDGQIVISMEALSQAKITQEKTIRAPFRARIDEDVYIHLGNESWDSPVSVPGSISFSTCLDEFKPEFQGHEDDVVVVAVDRGLTGVKARPKKDGKACQGFIKRGNRWRKISVQVVPMVDELFSRFGGLLETNLVADKRVAIFGVGSGGSQIGVELAKSGVTKFHLIDHDRLEVGNLVRHHCGLSDVGRLKVLAVADAIKEKNPYADVVTHPIGANYDTIETIERIVIDSDLIMVATDNQPSKLLLNRLCITHGKPAIFAGAHRRAYGGQVLRVRPKATCCYQCFAMLLPDHVQDQEISNPEQAEGLAYTDRPVPIEPGLANDIAPIAQMAVKLAIQELLQNKSTTLRSLDEDLNVPWYLWLNRREAETQYEELQPLQNNIDGMTILRWYGIDIEPYSACPVCGDQQALVERLTAAGSDSMTTLDSIRRLASGA